MRKSYFWGATLISMTTAIPAQTVLAQETTLQLVYPPVEHQTQADRIFFIGTADPDQPVFINGVRIEDRSEKGHFAPSLPLDLGKMNLSSTRLMSLYR
jgi:N-acetylmuramoyl-L-alanine amidase